VEEATEGVDLEAGEKMPADTKEEEADEELEALANLTAWEIEEDSGDVDTAVTLATHGLVHEVTTTSIIEHSACLEDDYALPLHARDAYMRARRASSPARARRPSFEDSPTGATLDAMEQGLLLLPGMRVTPKVHPV